MAKNKQAVEEGQPAKFTNVEPVAPTLDDEAIDLDTIQEEPVVTKKKEPQPQPKRVEAEAKAKANVLGDIRANKSQQIKTGNRIMFRG